MRHTSVFSTIGIHAAAPEKPESGEKCNGCGVCCLVAPCPVSALFLAHQDGACPALVWQHDLNIYRCGMLHTPGRFCRWIPTQLNRLFIFLIRRWLAIGVGCDCDVVVE